MPRGGSAICPARSTTSRPRCWPPTASPGWPASRPRGCRWSRARSVWGRRSRRCRTSSASVSTTPTTPRESGQPIPAEPIVFAKSISAIIGPSDPVKIPRGSKKTDWEVELGVVVGQRAAYVPASSAMDSRRRLLHRERRLGARVPARARRHLVQGQELRDLRAGRAVAGDQGRDPGSAEPPAVARGRRPPLPGQLDRADDLQRGAADQLHEPHVRAPAGRHRRDRNAAGCWRRNQSRPRSSSSPATSCASASRAWASSARRSWRRSSGATAAPGGGVAADRLSRPRDDRAERRAAPAGLRARVAGARGDRGRPGGGAPRRRDHRGHQQGADPRRRPRRPARP